MAEKPPGLHQPTGFQTRDKDGSQFCSKQTPQPRSCVYLRQFLAPHSQPQWNAHWFSLGRGNETWRNGKCSWDLRATREEQNHPGPEDCPSAFPEPGPPLTQPGSRSSSTLSCGWKRKENICTQTCARTPIASLLLTAEHQTHPNAHQQTGQPERECD